MTIPFGGINSTKTTGRCSTRSLRKESTWIRGKTFSLDGTIEMRTTTTGCSTPPMSEKGNFPASALGN